MTAVGVVIVPRQWYVPLGGIVLLLYVNHLFGRLVVVKQKPEEKKLLIGIRICEVSILSVGLTKMCS